MAHFPCKKCAGVNRIKSRSPEQKKPICGRCKTALDDSGAPLDVDAQSLASIVRTSPVPVLVDFWAPWCGPCRMIAPALKSIAEARAGELIVLKLNTDEHQAPARSFSISGLPTMVLFEKGAEVARQSGALPRPRIEAWLDGRR